jgi:hypothetical protein
MSSARTRAAKTPRQTFADSLALAREKLLPVVDLRTEA